MLEVQAQGVTLSTQNDADSAHLAHVGKLHLSLTTAPFLSDLGSAVGKGHCGIAALQFSNGKTAVHGLLDTPYSTVLTQGDVDLGGETLNLRVLPHDKGVNLSVATPVLVSGSLNAPSVQIEAGGLLLILTELAGKIALPHQL